MIREYALTEEEFNTICAALKHAEDDAVHPNASARFHVLHHELHAQHDDQEPKKITEVDNE